MERTGGIVVEDERGGSIILRDQNCLIYYNHCAVEDIIRERRVSDTTKKQRAEDERSCVLGRTSGCSRSL